MILSEIDIQCPFCFVRQTILVEPDGGESQATVSDCEVCCHPMDIAIRWSEQEQAFTATANKSSGFNE